jgi:hypothetical protein
MADAPKPSTTSPSHGADGPAAGRRRPGWLALAAAVTATALLTSLTTAWAGHQFSDVPDTSPFHDEIDWLVDTGIADGYEDGTFRPANAVSRQAMAAFLKRFYDQQAGLWAVSTSSTATNASRTEGWKTVGGHTGTSVKVPPGTTARIVTTVALAHSCESGRPGGFLISGAPYCELRVRIDGSEAPPGPVFISYSDLTDAQIAGDEADALLQPRAASFTFVSPVVGPGTHTVEAQVRAMSDRSGEPHPGVGVYDSTIVSEVMLLDRL